MKNIVINVFLDLDETVIYSKEIKDTKEITRLINQNNSLHYFYEHDYITFIRPGLINFIQYLKNKFNDKVKIHVFTASNVEYMTYILTNLNAYFKNEIKNNNKYQTKALKTFNWFDRITLSSNHCDDVLKKSKHNNAKDLHVVTNCFCHCIKFENCILIDNLAEYSNGQHNNVFIIEDFDLKNQTVLPKKKNCKYD